MKLKIYQKENQIALQGTSIAIQDKYNYVAEAIEIEQFKLVLHKMCIINNCQLMDLNQYIDPRPRRLHTPISVATTCSALAWIALTTSWARASQAQHHEHGRRYERHGKLMNACCQEL